MLDSPTHRLQHLIRKPENQAIFLEPTHPPTYLVPRFALLEAGLGHNFNGIVLLGFHASGPVAPREAALCGRVGGWVGGMGIKEEEEVGGWVGGMGMEEEIWWVGGWVGLPFPAACP